MRQKMLAGLQEVAEAEGVVGQLVGGELEWWVGEMMGWWYGGLVAWWVSGHG